MARLKIAPAADVQPVPRSRPPARLYDRASLQGDRMEPARTLVAPLALALAALGASAGTAAADTPVVGEYWAVPAFKAWLEGGPSAEDASGKITIHWFCKPKLEACRDDLARIYNMREQQSRVYVVAYIDGTLKDARKLDPVRGDVGAGAVTYGKPVAAMMKSMGVGASALPMSIVIGTDGKVALVTTTGDPEALDRRDARIASMVSDIHEYVIGSSSPAGTVKVGQSFELGLKIELASWLRFDPARPALVTLTPPPDVTCSETRLGPDKMKVIAGTLEAKLRCQAAVKGSYEAKGTIRFNFIGPRGAIGVGDDGVKWKFEVRPDPATSPPPKPAPPPRTTPTVPPTRSKPSAGTPTPTKP
jgi:hypothetical protein